jgi:hypothetical protein
MIVIIILKNNNWEILENKNQSKVLLFYNHMIQHF